MNRSRSLTWIALAASLSVGAALSFTSIAATGQTDGDPRSALAPAAPPSAVAADGALLALLPAQFRETGAAILRESAPDAREQLIWKLEDAAYAGAWDAPLNPEVVRFLVALEDAGRCSSRWQPCVLITASNLRKTRDPLLRRALERWVASHPDPEVVTAALEALESAETNELSGLLAERVELARSAGDAATLRRLGRTQEGLGATGWGVAKLPAFFWDPPPVFSLRPATAAVRVVAVSDLGAGWEQERQPAEAVAAYHRAHPFDFGITLGDNYQDEGAHGPADPRWKEYWEREYGPLAIPFYACLGNHDWGTQEGPAAEILYSQRNPQWHLPAPYYTYTAGPVQLFALNTVLMSEAQLAWLREELAKSTSRYKVVYGHYQIYSAVRGDDADMIKRLLPVLEAGHVDVYLCGHEHLFQHLKREGSVNFFVNAAAGGGGRAVEKPGYGGLLFAAEKRQGFTVLQADGSGLTVEFVGEDGARLYARTFQK